MSIPAGYSQTPLAKKLGIKEGFTMRVVNAPDNYLKLFTDFPIDVTITENQQEKKHFIHYFTKSTAHLQRDIPALKNEIMPNGMIWISWPKKTSKVATDVTEDVIREIAVKHDLVDIKVCAVDATWSGLKLVIPIKSRTAK